MSTCTRIVGADMDLRLQWFPEIGLVFDWICEDEEKGYIVDFLLKQLDL